MARRMVLTGPLSTPSRSITYFDTDAHAVLFPHNDTLVVTMHIENCRVSKILVDAGSSVNILYGGALDRMDTLEMARAISTRKPSLICTGLTATRLNRPAQSRSWFGQTRTTSSWSST